MTATTDVSNGAAPVAKKPRVEMEDNVEAQIEACEKIEASIDKIEDEQSEAILQLEQKYVKQKMPLYKQRADTVKAIPQFWHKALLNHPTLSCLIDENDEEVLQFLDEICLDQVSKDEKVDGLTKALNFAIEFKFKENPFFDNSSIIKKFYQVGEDVVSECDGIKWKEGKNLLEMKKPNQPAAGDNPEMDNETSESFFQWFVDHEDASNDDTADAIKDDLYVRALSYYLNEDGSEDGDGSESLGSEDDEAE